MKSRKINLGDKFKRLHKIYLSLYILRTDLGKFWMINLIQLIKRHQHLNKLAPSLKDNQGIIRAHQSDLTKLCRGFPLNKKADGKVILVLSVYHREGLGQEPIATLAIIRESKRIVCNLLPVWILHNVACKQLTTVKARSRHLWNR